MKSLVVMLGMLVGFGLMSKSLSAEEPESPFPKTDLSKIKEVFQKLDADGDGKLSLEEFAKYEKMRGDLAGPGAGPGPGTGKFGKFGNIDPEKLKMLKEKFGGKFDPAKLKELKQNKNDNE